MDLLSIAESTVKIVLILGLPSLLVSMIIGLVISIFQAVTQVSDASLTFVPKLILVSFFILISLPWMGDHVQTYTKDLWDLMLIFGEK
ncbi:MAG: flagellar biosynthetic protein FliQ [Arcobacteraceae bacterium]|jgi:flagellar biosynthetic protein FliQ|nr:flagellar biosynthetic protein FliQ [Arcobacteraceae bacterium]